MELVDDLAEGLARRRLAGRSWRAQAVQDALGGAQAQDTGLAMMLRRLERAGLGDAIRSWQGPGPHQRIPPQQLHAALGCAEVARLAGRAGLTGDELTEELSERLPVIVAALPRGRAPRRRPA